MSLHHESIEIGELYTCVSRVHFRIGNYQAIDLDDTSGSFLVVDKKEGNPFSTIDVLWREYKLSLLVANDARWGSPWVYWEKVQ